MGDTNNYYEEAKNESDVLLKRAVKELQTPLGIPTTSGVSLRDTENSIAKAKTSRDSLDAILDTEGGRFSAAIAAEQKAITAGGIDKAGNAISGQAGADMAMATQARAQRDADLMQNLINIMGASVPDLADLAAKSRSEGEIARAKLSKVQEMQALSPMDNLPGWIITQMALPSVVKDYNRQADIANQIEADLTNRIQTTRAAQEMSGKGMPVITTDEALATAKARKAEADKEIALSEKQLAAQNTSFANAKLAADMSIANADINKSQLQIKNEEMAYTSKLNAVKLAQTNTERLIKAGELAASLADSHALDLAIEQADNYLGNPKGTHNRFSLKMLSAKERDNFMAFAAGNAGIGPYSAYVNVMNAGAGPLFGEQKTKMFQWIGDKIPAIRKELVTKGVPKEEHEIYMNKQLVAFYEKEAATAANTTSSIMHELTPTEMLRQNPGLVNTPVGQALLDFKDVKGNVATEDVLGAIAKRYPGDPVKAGIATSEFYQKNIALRNQVMQLDSIGIKPPTDYILVVSDPRTAFGTNTPVDLTNPSKATSWFLFRAIQAKMDKVLGNSGSWNPLDPNIPGA